MNALAVVAAALALGVSMGVSKQALKTHRGARRMMRRHAACGAILLEDSYNANFWSFNAALKTLAS